MKNYVKAGLLGLLAMGLFAACEKEKDKTKEPVVEEYEKTLYFDPVKTDSVMAPVVQRFVNDPNCTKIYLTTTRGAPFESLPADAMSYLRSDILEPCINLSPKVTGRGEMYREPGQTNPADSIWYIQNGWTFKMR
ncbi:MAG: hypothetical protein NC048_00870 [Bacteroides sp.]|nr:hypothetical protein [Ruminococcus flavefaciens]MCM1554033.1 hypothetical protein [Bacteroides sp.]